jgi:Raf kinase inhibitor-like YbhB/YbcL family protein
MTTLRKLLISSMIAMAVATTGEAQTPPPSTTGAPAPNPLRLTLISPAFNDGDVIPDKFAAAATTTAVSPAFSWKNAPDTTISFAILMHDPDEAPNKNSMDFTHWIIFNIPANVNSLPEDVPHTAQLADGSVQAKLRNGPGYGGPGARFVYHHYTFELFALDTKLTLGTDATREQFLDAMNGHIVAKAAYVGRFHR